MLNETTISIALPILTVIFQVILPYLIRSFPTLVAIHHKFRLTRYNRIRMGKRNKNKNNKRKNRKNGEIDRVQVQGEDGRDKDEERTLNILVIKDRSTITPHPLSRSRSKSKSKSTCHAISIPTKYQYHPNPNQNRNKHKNKNQRGKGKCQLLKGPPPGFEHVHPTITPEENVFCPRPRTVQYNLLEYKVQEWQIVLIENPHAFDQRDIVMADTWGRDRSVTDPDWVNIKLDIDAFIRAEQHDLELGYTQDNRNRERDEDDHDWEKIQVDINHMMEMEQENLVLGNQINRLIGNEVAGAGPGIHGNEQEEEDQGWEEIRLDINATMISEQRDLEIHHPHSNHFFLDGYAHVTEQEQEQGTRFIEIGNSYTQHDPNPYWKSNSTSIHSHITSIQVQPGLIIHAWTSEEGNQSNNGIESVYPITESMKYEDDQSAQDGIEEEDADWLERSEDYYRIGSDSDSDISSLDLTESAPEGDSDVHSYMNVNSITDVDPSSSIFIPMSHVNSDSSSESDSDTISTTGSIDLMTEEGNESIASSSELSDQSTINQNALDIEQDEEGNTSQFTNIVLSTFVSMQGEDHDSSQESDLDEDEYSDGLSPWFIDNSSSNQSDSSISFLVDSSHQSSSSFDIHVSEIVKVTNDEEETEEDERVQAGIMFLSIYPPIYENDRPIPIRNHSFFVPP